MQRRERSVFRYFFFFFFFFFFFVFFFFQNHHKARERTAKDERNTTAGCSVGERVRRVDRDEIETERVLGRYLDRLQQVVFVEEEEEKKKKKKKTQLLLGYDRWYSFAGAEVRGKSHTGRRVHAERDL